MVAASALLVVVVAVAFAVLLSAIGDLRGSTRWTEHSVFVLGASTQLQNDVGNLTTATRSYVANPDAAGLRSWRAVRARLPMAAGRLRGLVTDNPAQTGAASMLSLRIKAYADEWAGPLVAMAGRPGSLRHAQVLVRAPAGQTLSADIRDAFENFNARETALGLSRGSSSRQHARTAELIAVGALVALVLAIVALALVLARSVAIPVRRVAAAAAHLGRGDLSARGDERSRGEMRDLAHAFNSMAESLRDSRDELESQNHELEAQQADLEDALERLADEKERVEGFQSFIELVSAENDPDRLADTVLAELSRYLGAPVGTLYGVDNEHGSALTCLAALGVDNSSLPEEILPGEGFAGRAIVAREIVTAGFGAEGLRFESFGREVTLGEEIHIPLVHGEQSVGVVTLGRTAPGKLTAQDLERIRYLAAQAAVGLSHAFALRGARNQAALNRAVLEGAYDAFVSFDERGIVTAWNPRAEAVFGWSAREAIGRDIARLVVPRGDRDWYRESLGRFIEGEESDMLNRRVEVTARHRDAREVPEAQRNARFFRAGLRVSEALAHADTLEQDLDGTLAAAGESLGWEFGAAWLPDEEGRAMRCVSNWDGGGETASDLTTRAQVIELAPGEGIVGRAWQTGEPSWVPDLAAVLDDPSHPHARFLHGTGVRAVVAVPLVGTDGVVAVLQLLSREPREPDDDTLRVLVAIGEQVGHAVYRGAHRGRPDEGR